MSDSWPFQAHAGPLNERYTKEENTALAFMTAGDPGPVAFSRPQTTAGLGASWSSASLLDSHASMPTLRVKPRGYNPVTGCQPEEIVETRDWMSTSHRTHAKLPRAQPRMAGRETRFGVRDQSGKVQYLSNHFGTAEALGQAVDWRPSSTAADEPPLLPLRRSPSAVELEQLLMRRSRARGLGGKHTKVCDVVQPKWSVMFGAGSASSVSMIPK